MNLSPSCVYLICKIIICQNWHYKCLICLWNWPQLWVGPVSFIKGASFILVMTKFWVFKKLSFVLKLILCHSKNIHLILHFYILSLVSFVFGDQIFTDCVIVAKIYMARLVDQHLKHEHNCNEELFGRCSNSFKIELVLVF